MSLHRDKHLWLERLRLEREERRQRLREEMAEPLSAELQAKVDALNRRLQLRVLEHQPSRLMAT